MEEAENSVEVYLCIVLVEFDELGEVKEKVCDNFFEVALTQNLEHRMEFFKEALGVFQPAWNGHGHQHNAVENTYNFGVNCWELPIQSLVRSQEWNGDNFGCCS